MKLNWNFLGGGIKTKNLPWGEYGYFLELHILVPIVSITMEFDCIKIILVYKENYIFLMKNYCYKLNTWDGDILFIYRPYISSLDYWECTGGFISIVIKIMNKNFLTFVAAPSSDNHNFRIILNDSY